MAQAIAQSIAEGPVPVSETVVIVDPDAALLRALRFDLELEGFCVRAYRTIASLNPSSLPLQRACLVIEENLPGESGLELLQRLRAASVSIPAIIMTSRPTAALAARAGAAGAVVLEKPLLGGALTVSVRHILARAGALAPP